MTYPFAPLRRILSGDEAVALAACDAHLTLCTGYPGTPSIEILESLDALGGRALVTMMHVGLNVAADPLFTVAYTGVRGALVIVSADDPDMASSQNEQDNRRYAVAARLPMLEPADSQEAYNFTLLAIEVSERWSIPVLLRITTRVCHSKTIVETPGYPVPPAPAPAYVRDVPERVMIPAYARPAHRRLRAMLTQIAEWNEREGPSVTVQGRRRCSTSRARCRTTGSSSPACMASIKWKCRWKLRERPSATASAHSKSSAPASPMPSNTCSACAFRCASSNPTPSNVVKERPNASSISGCRHEGSTALPLLGEQARPPHRPLPPAGARRHQHAGDVPGRLPTLRHSAHRRLRLAACQDLLEAEGFVVRVTEVVAVEVPDHPGGLLNVLDLFEGSTIKIEYMYAFPLLHVGNAALIFRFDYPDAAIQKLRAGGIRVLNADALNSR